MDVCILDFYFFPFCFIGLPLVLSRSPFANSMCCSSSLTIVGRLSFGHRERATLSICITVFTVMDSSLTVKENM